MKFEFPHIEKTKLINTYLWGIFILKNSAATDEGQPTKYHADLKSAVVQNERFVTTLNAYPTKTTPTGKQSLKMVGVFNKYHVGVFNPAFTGMYLWELSCSHELNDYQICPHHSIKSGIILYGAEAYVFTQITNNDITSHLKILIRGKRFTNDMTLAQAMKL